LTPAVGRTFATVRRSSFSQVNLYKERRRTVADQPDQGAMVVKMVVKNRRRDLSLCRPLVLVSPVAERDDVSEGHALERRPGLRGAAMRSAAGCPRRGAGSRSTTRHARTAQSGSSRCPMTSSPSSFKRVNAVSQRMGKCRQARRAHRPSRGMRRCRHASRVGRVQASAPEFGELLGKRSALVVTGSSGGRTQR
jgi:hypothetical protein